MNCIGTQGIPAFDFYLSIRRRELPTDCCGPIVYILLNEAAAQTILTGLTEANSESLLADTYISRISDLQGKFGSCAGHWLNIIAITSEMGSKLHRHDLEMTADVLFKTVCSQAGWDYKEMSNYLNSFSLEGNE